MAKQVIAGVRRRCASQSFFPGKILASPSGMTWHDMKCSRNGVILVIRPKTVRCDSVPAATLARYVTRWKMQTQTAINPLVSIPGSGISCEQTNKSWPPARSQKYPYGVCTPYPCPYRPPYPASLTPLFFFLEGNLIETGAHTPTSRPLRIRVSTPYSKGLGWDGMGWTHPHTRPCMEHGFRLPIPALLVVSPSRAAGTVRVRRIQVIFISSRSPPLNLKHTVRKGKARQGKARQAWTNATLRRKTRRYIDVMESLHAPHSQGPNSYCTEERPLGPSSHSHPCAITMII